MDYPWFRFRSCYLPGSFRCLYSFLVSSVKLSPRKYIVIDSSDIAPYVPSPTHLSSNSSFLSSTTSSRLSFTPTITVILPVRRSPARSLVFSLCNFYFYFYSQRGVPRPVGEPFSITITYERRVGGGGRKGHRGGELSIAHSGFVFAFQF